jgi:Lactonase, 7-bladed beta-propeller
MRKISRRNFIQRSAAATLAAQPLFASAKALDTKKLLLVGTQTSGTSKGIYAYTFDSATGDLTQTGLAAETQNPTFLALAPNGKTLIAANELDDIGAVSSFTLDRATAKLTKVNQESAKGGGTCHVSVDHTGHSAFAANYGGGSAVSFMLSPAGQLSPAVSFFQYTGKGPKPQQNSAHAHRVTVSPDNRFLLVNDLGLDMIHIYHLDAATATPHAARVEVCSRCRPPCPPLPPQRQTRLLRQRVRLNGQRTRLECRPGHTGDPPDSLLPARRSHWPLRPLRHRHRQASPLRLRRQPSRRLHGELHHLTN